MEYTTKKEKFNVMATAFEGCKEQPIDIDLTLPDYCPDVRRVLKCKVTPQMGLKTITGDNLTVDGNINITILYCDGQNGAVRCHEHNVAYSCTFNLKNPPSDYIILAKAKTEYINCRALTSRRLDLHGAFNVCVRVLTKEEKEVVGAFSEDDLEQRFNKSTVTTLNAFGQQQFSITETTPLPQSKPEIQSILQKSVDIIVDDVKLISEKAMVKGFANIRILYIGDIDKGLAETFEYSLPFNEIIDIQGGDENSYYFISSEVNSVTITGVSENDENTVNTDIRFTLTALLFKDITVTTVEDIYSTKYNIAQSNQKMSLPVVSSEIKDTIIEKTCLEFNEKQLSEIMDLWVEGLQFTYETLDNKPMLKGKLVVNILGKDSENEVFLSERAIDMEYVVEEMGNNNAHFELESAIQALSFRMNGNSGIELRADVKLNCLGICDKQNEFVCEVNGDDELVNEDKNTSFILYYSEVNEELWDIAKKYKITRADIMEENELTDDKSSGGLLILPV